MIYPDSGCLVKFYYPEPDSSQVIDSIQNEPLLCTRLHELEVVSALEGKRFRGEATEQQVKITIDHLRNDLASGVLRELEVEWASVLRLATSLAETHARITGTRAIDTLHCAVAQSAGATVFLTTDARQRALAQALHLSLLP